MAAVGAGVIGLVCSVSSTVPAAAIDEVGSISLSGTGTATTFPCNGCAAINFSPTVTSGSVSGVSGSAFTLAWATSTQMSVGLNTICGTSPNLVDELLSSASLTISGAQLVYGATSTQATVTITFNLTQDVATELVASGLVVQVNPVSTVPPFSFSPVILPQGALILAPVGTNTLCPNATGPVTLNLSGTLWSVM